MMRPMFHRARSYLTAPWLTVRVQIALGAIFVASALPKLVDPPSFAHAIYNYRIVPEFALNAMAMTLPWLELLCGLALVLGIWRKAAATLIGGLLVVFIVAISINLQRDNAVNCGCFDVSSADKTQQQLLDEMRVVVVRDIGMLLMVAQILAASSRRVERYVPVSSRTYEDDPKRQKKGLAHETN